MAENLLMPVMKYRINKWFNSKTLKVFFGIDAKIGKSWYHLQHKGKPVWFDDEADAKKKLKEYRKSLNPTTNE